jgi:hypothetical protein
MWGDVLMLLALFGLFALVTRLGLHKSGIRG